MDTGNKCVKFRLNPNFYSRSAIVGALDNFKSICSGEFREKEFEIELRPKKPCNLKELGLEFCNYCLGLMK